MRLWRRLFRPAPAKAGSVRLLSRLATLERLVAQPLSLARFGDGEAGFLFRGLSVPFQNYDARLAAKLRAALTSPDDRLLLAYNNHFMQQDEWPIVVKYPRGNKVPARFETVWSQDDVGYLERRKQRRMYERYFAQLTPLLQDRHELGDATVFFLGYYYEEYKRGELGRVFELFRGLFAAKRILFVCPRRPILGASFFDLVERGVLRAPSNVQFIDVPNENAFAGYDALLAAIAERRADVDRVMLQVGPTATALVHELTARYGLTCYDVGSLNTSLELAWKLDKIVF